MRIPSRHPRRVAIPCVACVLGALTAAADSAAPAVPAPMAASPAAASPAAAPAADVVTALPSFRPALEREWCVGSGPASWGFAVTPTEACVGIHLRSRSSAVRITSVRSGPGAPEGWTASQVGDREVALTGAIEVAAGSTLSTALIVETNRATAELSSKGATPPEWEVWFTDAAGTTTRTGRMNASFPPVLDLADAAARGTVLVTCEALGSRGPVEITVDNPTTSPLWLDVPTGSTIMAGGREWIVGLAPPFRMMRRQKAGMTVNAFPVDAVPPGTASPRRFTLGARSCHATAQVQEIALAASRLRAAGRQGMRRPGAFEAAQPYDFFPLVLTWKAWQSLPAPPPRQMLIDDITSLLLRKAGSGDALAAQLDPVAAAAEVEAMVGALAAEVDAIRAEALPVDLQCARARFR